MGHFGKALLCSMFWIVSTVRGFSFPTQDDESPGIKALHFGKHVNTWGRLDFGGVDGTVKTSPPDTIKYDRKIEAAAELGTERMLTPDLSGRANLKAGWEIHKEEEKDPPKSPIERSISTFEPSLDVTYVNPRGLEMFVGVGIFSQGEYTESQVSDSASSDTVFGSINLFVPRFGMVRRTPTWSGGFYYIMGREGFRDFTKTASDDSTVSGKSPVYIPAVLGIVGEVPLSVVDIELDLSQIRAGSGGEKSDKGITVRDDYLHLGISGYRDFGGYGLRIKLIHHTLSYGNNAFLNMESVPVTSAHFLFLDGSKDANVYYGIIYGFGKDGQSIPEFNADYKFHALALTTGLFIPM
jgi:hypothetical protein